MNINQLKLMIAIGLSSSSTLHTFFNIDEFDKDFFKEIQIIEKNIQKSFNQFHEIIFTEISPHNHYLQENQPNKTFYQKNSNSLSFTNQEKAIKIIEEKDTKTTLYTIEVTDKKKVTLNLPTNNHNCIEELKELLNYIKKNFNAQKAEKVIEACIKAIIEMEKDKLVKVKTSTHANQKIYTIKIEEQIPEQKEQNNLPEEQEVEEGEPESLEDNHRKKKKLAHFLPRHKIKH